MGSQMLHPTQGSQFWDARPHDVYYWQTTLACCLAPFISWSSTMPHWSFWPTPLTLSLSYICEPPVQTALYVNWFVQLVWLARITSYYWERIVRWWSGRWECWLKSCVLAFTFEKIVKHWLERQWQYGYGRMCFWCWLMLQLESLVDPWWCGVHYTRA
jgi:hypothetical protein